MFILYKHNSIFFYSIHFMKRKIGQLRKKIWNKYHVIKLCISSQLKHINEYSMKFNFFLFFYRNEFFYPVSSLFFYTIPDLFLWRCKRKVFFISDIIFAGLMLQLFVHLELVAIDTFQVVWWYCFCVCKCTRVLCD